MHYDPNRFGIGQGGYWRYPHGKNTPPIGGLPGTPGAETGAGEYDDHGDILREFPVGSYPDAQSPWGMLDGSGGQMELLEVYQTEPILQADERVLELPKRVCSSVR